VTATQARRRRYYERTKAKGLCWYCKTEPARDSDSVGCEGCLTDKAAARYKWWFQRPTQAIKDRVLRRVA